MILIISKRNYEKTTESVIDWLNSMNANYIRLNGVDICSDFSLVKSTFSSKGKDIDLSKVSAVWYRRWFDDDFFSSKLADLDIENAELLNIHIYLTKELNSLRKAFFKVLEDANWISREYELSIQKNDQLLVAKEAGFKIPDTLITTRKKDLISFVEKHGRVISKNMSDPIHMIFDDEGSKKSYMSKTIEIDSDLLLDISDVFFPSLFQELIEKQYELRVFFCKEKIYPMAIFSQLDEQTSIDYRIYNDEKPNRTVPYKLPSHILDKLIYIKNKLGLSTGSFDLIRSEEGQYIFLEVNPVGQFGMVSKPCNYYIEKEVASTLIQMDNGED